MMLRMCTMSAAMAALIGSLMAPPASAQQQLPAELQNPNVDIV